MLRTLLIATAFLPSAAALCAGERPTLGSSALDIVTLRKVDRDAQIVEQEIVRYVPVQKNVTVAKKVIVDGVERIVQEAKTVTEQTRLVTLVQRSLKELKVLTGAGKELTGDARWQVLKEGVIILQAQGEVDPRWFKILRPEAIILLSQAQGALTPGQPPVPKEIEPAR